MANGNFVQKMMNLVKVAYLLRKKPSSVNLILKKLPIPFSFN